MTSWAIPLSKPQMFLWLDTLLYRSCAWRSLTVAGHPYRVSRWINNLAGRQRGVFGALKFLLWSPGGATQQSFIRGGSAPRSNPLPFYIPNSKKVALAIGHWQLGIGHLGIRNTMQCFAWVTAKQQLPNAQLPNAQSNLYWIRYIPFLTEKYPFCIPSIEKWCPFHIPT